MTEEGRTEMKTKSLKKDKPGALVTEGSGNVFSDLGLPNPETGIDEDPADTANLSHHPAARHDPDRSREGPQD
jgi:hypothetical protein